MEKLKHIFEDIECMTYNYIESHEDDTDALNICELEKASKIMKNLSEAIYYCTIVEAMESGDHATIELNPVAHTVASNE